MTSQTLACNALFFYKKAPIKCRDRQKMLLIFFKKLLIPEWNPLKPIAAQLDKNSKYRYSSKLKSLGISSLCSLITEGGAVNKTYCYAIRQKSEAQNVQASSKKKGITHFLRKLVIPISYTGNAYCFAIAVIPFVKILEQA